MPALLKFAFGIDWLNDRLSRLATWTVLLAAAGAFALTMGTRQSWGSFFPR